MKEDQLPRKLSAILHADVVGYSRLTGEDEEATHRRVKAYLDLIKSITQQYHGKVLNLAGDAALADFPTASDALFCAAAIQLEIKQRNEDLAESRKIRFRIGVNLGEVIVDLEQIFGDGVNVAARLQVLAEPGGICISGSVYDTIGNKVPFEYQSLGEQKVKNIAKPVRAYRATLRKDAALPRPGVLAKPRRLARYGMAMTVLGVVVGAIVWFASKQGEISSLPHVEYDYESNYPQHFLRLKKPPPGELKAILNLRNTSHYVLKNLEIRTYLLLDNTKFSKFARPFELDASDYLFLGSHKFARIEPGERLPINILDVLLKLYKSQDVFAAIMLPEIGKWQTLPRLNPTAFVKQKPAQVFTNDAKLLLEEFEQLVPGTSLYGYGFHGAMLKLIVQYSVNDFTFKHLVVGGAYYKYVITTLIPVPYKEAAVAVAASGFYKTTASFWSKSGENTFSYINLPQQVVDRVEQGIFTSNVDGPIRPGEEVTLRVEPQVALRPAKGGSFLPVPMYLFVENNVGKPRK